MKNIILLGICFLLNIIALILCIKQTRDVFQNPTKYNTIKNEQQYRNSFWYEPLSEYHQKFFAKNYIAPVLVDCSFGALFILLYLGIAKGIRKLCFIPVSATALTSSNDHLYIGLGAEIFFEIVFTAFLCYKIPIPIFTACTMTLFNSKKRSDDWKKLTVLLLLGIVLCLPIMSLGLNTYAYAEDTRIVENKLLQIQERELHFQDAVHMETSYTSNADASEFYFEGMVTFSDGSTFNLFAYDELQTDEWLDKLDIPIYKGEISQEEYEKMCAVYNVAYMNSILRLFDVV